MLRIIGGRFRGRKLPVANIDGLRPTGDRIRETLFNWLAPWLVDARCLDLFAGSGALGLEALSRGAAHVELWEKHPAAAGAIAESLSLLQAAQARLSRGDTLDTLQQAPRGAFDIVFLDPPFAGELWQPCIDALGPWLAQEAWVYIESPIEANYTVPNTWQAYRQKQAGRVCYALFRVLPG
ncbi:16S rRNA (guanine(966)-N(2))-methyltransferase RsmD [Gilvimarinus sp. SDUM040013]|uniref:Ribosomal RNA small subunit methyltransferase D n=1 Tax=Gilvimarinus gilvus TaxID=3058038 RepID=A0ABU4RZS9_9GAMM|nr:16S rRNA (guanine(966)-N(2))-methyltransferase RsmD [Gilvimarinus sp. SDUM040013]MDO3387561.1 16S rRNA (guanine(966)-N(2))-methyltransferase RsmD [Gilvimarinus sp. SDUM040013]MDX6850174.1 16S rRNA (guanine(966)-N(2))-methyltransferase RsmD [Gilvimarinus sp. SDUM040013]